MGEVVKLRGLYANNNPTTQLSRRLADKLGLTEFKSVYIGDNEFGGNAVKWKVSLFPVAISGFDGVEPDEKAAICYPVINCQPKDAYWELILGQDWLNVVFVKGLYRRADSVSRPAPGPSFSKDEYLGHNVRIVSKLGPNVNVFVEYHRLGSETVSRIAVNKITRQLAVVLCVSPCSVHLFEQLPTDLEKMIEDGASRDEVLAQARAVCQCSEVESFPETVMLKGLIKRAYA